MTWTDGKPPDGPCANCNERPATKWYAPNGVMGATHGFVSGWCDACLLATAIAHANEQWDVRRACTPEMRDRMIGIMRDVSTWIAELTGNPAMHQRILSLYTLLRAEGMPAPDARVAIVTMLDNIAPGWR